MHRLGEGTVVWPSSTLLGALSAETRAHLLHLGTQRAYCSGGILLAEGELSDHVFLLLRGWLKVTRVGDGDREILMAIRAAGDIVGELAAFDRQSRIATVRAAAACNVRRIGRRDFLDFLRDHDEASRLVMKAVGEKLRSATRRRSDVMSHAPDVRVARLLLDLLGQHGQLTSDGIVITPPLTQPDVAALVGASQPTVQRVLRHLRESGVIATGYRRILVRDPDQLRLRAGVGAFTAVHLPDAPVAVGVPRARPPVGP
ncbi:MAG TPA: Crp/Fnr family transcriptional regulator [Kineosporiaceae bacterium]